MDKIETLSTHDEEKLKAAEQAIADAGADEAKKLEALKNFHEAFNNHYKHVATTIETEGAKAAAEEKVAADAEAEALAVEDEIKQLEAELEALEKADDGADNEAGDRVKAIAGKPLADYLKSKADTFARLTVVAESLKQVNSDPATAFKLPNDEIVQLAENWDSTFEAYQNEVNQVTADVEALKQTSEELAKDTTAADVQDLLKAVEADAATLKSSVEEDKERNAAREESIKEFEFERSRLLLWCRQQKTNLDGMSEPDHVQEFCASLLNNYNAMEENFNIIYERAIPLLPDLKVQAALLEVNEVWLNLQVSSYDRLRFTLLEIHASSKLEDEVRAFSHYSQRAGDFLNEFSKLLATPTDEDSQDVVKPVIDDCAALLKQYDAHKHLTEHMREFALRMECFRDNYTSLKRAVLSRLTFLAVTPTLATSQRRKDEYLGRMKELRSWVEVKSQGESWQDIHERVLKIRDLIAAEQASLNALPANNSDGKKDTTSTTN